MEIIEYRNKLCPIRTNPQYLEQDSVKAMQGFKKKHACKETTKHSASPRSKQKQSGRRLTPAGRIICFALLRAEMAENDAGEARRSPEIIENVNF